MRQPAAQRTSHRPGRQPARPPRRLVLLPQHREARQEAKGYPTPHRCRLQILALDKRPVAGARRGTETRPQPARHLLRHHRPPARPAERGEHGGRVSVVLREARIQPPQLAHSRAHLPALRRRPARPPARGLESHRPPRLLPAGGHAAQLPPARIEHRLRCHEGYPFCRPRLRRQPLARRTDALVGRSRVGTAGRPPHPPLERLRAETVHPRGEPRRHPAARLPALQRASHALHPDESATGGTDTHPDGQLPGRLGAERVCRVHPQRCAR